MQLVVVESPYKGTGKWLDVERNLRYVRAAMADCFSRGEAPFASHALYTQDGVLRDTEPAERRLGIEAGLLWGHHADLVAVYTDLGITPGMVTGIERHRQEGRPVEMRTLPEWLP